MESNLTENQQKALELIRQSPTEEILTEKRLIDNIKNGVPLVHYIGFEVSGYVHLGTGLLGATKIADFQAAGAKTSIFLADYHTWINKKLGGDIDVIRRVAGTYFKESLRVSLKCVGGDADKVKFVLGSELYSELNTKYLESILKTASHMSLSRAKRSITILGRREGEDVSLAQLIYVPMQIADIYGMGITLSHSGTDQRKAHVVALEVSKEFGYEPVAVHHHMLMGVHMTADQRNKILEAKKSGNRDAFENGIIEVKMSKSDPKSAIFIHDTEDQIRSKIMGVYCPAAELDVNAVIDLTRYIIWPYLRRQRREFEIVNGKSTASFAYKSQDELETAYVKSQIHPVDLKESVAKYLTELLEPARKYFLDGVGRKYLEEMNEIKITR
jgi:tyrosyl-tRNA synthetase